MEYIFLLPSFLTALTLMLYFYFIDPNKEPFKRLLEAFGVGFIVSLQIDWLQNFIPAVNNIFYTAFISAGLIEEGVKLVAIMLTLFRNRYFTEKVDGITYVVFLSLGFAVAENTVLIHTFETGLVRAFTSTVAHALFAVHMGYYVGKFKFTGKWLYVCLALFLPVMLHGLYNVLIMSGSFWGLFLFLPYLTFLWVLATKRHNTLKEKVVKNV